MKKIFPQLKYAIKHKDNNYLKSLYCWHTPMIVSLLKESQAIHHALDTAAQKSQEEFGLEEIQFWDTLQYIIEKNNLSEIRKYIIALPEDITAAAKRLDKIKKYDPQDYTPLYRTKGAILVECIFAINLLALAYVSHSLVSNFNVESITDTFFVHMSNAFFANTNAIALLSVSLIEISCRTKLCLYFESLFNETFYAAPKSEDYQVTR
jgi:hypothetical protein